MPDEITLDTFLEQLEDVWFFGSPLQESETARRKVIAIIRHIWSLKEAGCSAMAKLMAEHAAGEADRELGEAARAAVGIAYEIDPAERREVIGRLRGSADAQTTMGWEHIAGVLRSIAGALEKEGKHDAR